MTRALRRDESGLETPIIRDDLYAQSCVALLRRQGVIQTLSQEQLQTLAEMPIGPTQEIGLKKE
jgi:hypothetical protein